MSQGFTRGVPIDTDGTMATNSDLLVPSQAAVVSYVASQLATVPASVPPTRTISTTSPLTGGGDLSINRVLSIPAATTIIDGYLTSVDWTTFNNKVTSLSGGTGISIGGTTTVPIVTNTAPDQIVALTAGTGIGITGTYPNFTITNSSPSLGGTVTSVAALTLGTTGTDLSSTVANSTTTPVITLNVPTASATNRGALSSTDWSTFNGKADAALARIQSTFSNRVSGRYYGQDTNAAAATNIALATGTVYYTPIKVSGASLAIDQLAFNVAVTGTATEFRMAIYRDNGTSWLPDTVWVQTVSTAFSGTGAKTASISVNLSDSYNWFLAIQVNGSVTVTNINVASALTPWGTSAVSTVNATYLSNSMTYGSFLNNPTTSFVQGGPPRLMMRTL